MKKLILGILLLSLIISSVGCDMGESAMGSETKRTDIGATEIDTVGGATESEADSTAEEIKREEDAYSVNPARIASVVFRSPRRLMLALTNDKNGFDLRFALEDSVRGEPPIAPHFDKMFKLLDRFENGELTVRYPVIEGYGDDFFAKDVVLFSEEKFSLPTIWYRNPTSRNVLEIRILYPAADVIEYSKDHTISQTLNYISPTYPTVDYYYIPYEFGSYVEIGEKTVTTANGDVSVSYNVLESGKAQLCFIYKDMLVCIDGVKEEVYPELLNKLTFVDVE